MEDQGILLLYTATVRALHNMRAHSEHIHPALHKMMLLHKIMLLHKTMLHNMILHCTRE